MIGEKIHNYEITAHLGQGGMGTVYRATDTMLGREVALKMLHPQLTIQPQFLERFKKEARVLAQLLHPNIAVIYNFIEQNNNHFMVMEFVEGNNLDGLMKKYSVLSPEFVVPVFIQALEGLNHAHKKNVFHRDIKPANLMLTPEGVVKLMDFGIAKIAGEQKMTQVNKIIGTIEFMAPELIQGKEASASSDIYAMGLTLYEVLSGKLPFENDTDYNLMQAILKKKINPPEKLNASIPGALSSIVMKALEKNPENRYPDARSFQQALIKAFPNYREINAASLKPAVALAKNAHLSGAVTKLDDSLAAMETRMETMPGQTSAKETFKKSYRENKKLYLTIIALLLFLIIALGVCKNSSNSGLLPGQTDSLNKEENPIDVSNNSSTEYIRPPETVNTPVDNGNPVILPEDPGNKDGDKPKEKKPIKKEPVRTKEENRRIDPVVVVEEKKPVAREVYIKGKVEVELYLRENLENSPDRTDIPVTFTVRRDVVYEGVTIISQGAVAKGVIKLGRIQTDIDINTITAANGQQIKLKSQKNHGRRNEITSNRNYTALILPGVRLKF
ncbi:MAG: serine/threonine-protein kinase [Ferruginibacter sp.]